MSTTTVEDMRRLREEQIHPRSARGRAVRLARRGIGWLRARALLAEGATLGNKVVIDGHVRVAGEGDVVIGDRGLFLAGPIATELIAHANAEIRLGSGAIVNYGASFEATSSIVVGRNCMFGSYARITDRDHGISGPVVIEDEVWIAHGAYVGPGVTIGRGAVVAAGAVVMADVPAMRLAIGNPARAVSLSLVEKSRTTGSDSAPASADATKNNRPTPQNVDDTAQASAPVTNPPKEKSP
jgi:acetyltransferase-like isoleucine patch superfamily enzyme